MPKKANTKATIWPVSIEPASQQKNDTGAMMAERIPVKPRNVRIEDSKRKAPEGAKGLQEFTVDEFSEYLTGFYPVIQRAKFLEFFTALRLSAPNRPQTRTLADSLAVLNQLDSSKKHQLTNDFIHERLQKKE